MTKFVCISDTHTKHRELEMPQGNVLLHSGDISYTYKSDLLEERKQLIDFSEWLGELSYEHIVVVAGNHDFLFEKEEEEAVSILTQHNDRVHYLNQSSVTINGIKIYGEPRQPKFYDWAFNVSRNNMKDVWELVPDDVDILVTHGPPLGYGDVVENKTSFDLFHANQFERVGCKHMKNMIDSRIENPFKLITFGHIHEGYGQWYKPLTNTHIVNASVVNNKYKVKNKPVVIEILENNGGKY